MVTESVIADWLLVVKIRRWRWLPWPTALVYLEKRTTWGEIEGLAEDAVRMGAKEVRIWRKDD